MNLDDLKNFSSVAAPTRPEKPVLEIDPRWLQKFQVKVADIQADEPLVFAFPSDATEVLLELERKGLVKSSAFPFHAAKSKSGLFILGQRTGAQGWHAKVSDVDEAHALLCNDSKLSNSPTLVSTGKSEIVHFYPQGVGPAFRETYFELGLGGVATLSATSLKQALEFFATDKVLNKSCNRSEVWEDADKYWVHERAEKNIQRLLIMALQMNFKEGLVLDELPVPSGRTDVVVEEKKGASIIRYLLELKAVRKFSNKGSEYKYPAQLTHCTDGIIQALTNGEDLQADLSFLCAYDLRPSPDAALKTKVEEAAKPYSVIVGWYPVFKSAKEDRVSRVAKKIASG